MKYSKLFLLMLSLTSSAATAGVFAVLSTGQITVDTPAASTQPIVADFRLGYEYSQHQLELVLMSGMNDDTLNQLTVDIPSIISIFYRYMPYPDDRLKVHLILGASQIDVDSTFTGVPDSTDSFEGVSVGIGFEEAFKFDPDLKLKLDWVQLYNGDQININALSLGLRYEF